MRQWDGSSQSKGKNALRQAFLAFLVGLGLFAALFAVMNGAVRPFGTELSDSWTVYRRGEAVLPEEESIPISIPLNGLDTVVLETTVGPTQDAALALIWPDATAVDVFWNGRRIHQLGDPDRPTANLWNAAFAIPLPDSSETANRLRLELTSPYKIQLLRAPMIAPHPEVARRVFLHNVIYHDLRVLFMGAAIAVGIILILLARLQGASGLPGFLLGAAAVLAAVYAADYGMRVSTGDLTTYHWFRVVAIASGYTAALLFVAGLERYFHERFRLSWVIAAPIVISVLLIVASPSLAWLFRWLPVMNLVMFVDLLLVLVLLARRLHVHRFLLVPCTIITLSLLEIIFVMAAGLPWPPLLQFTVLITAILFSVQIITDYTDVYYRHQELEAAYNRDALTGAYNRHLLDNIEVTDYDVVVVTDLDNFKAYNDTHGHAAGDAVLRTFASTLVNNTRDEDLVVRYGGDEFVTLIRRATEDEAVRIMQRVRKRFRWEVRGVPLDVSFGVQSISPDAPLRFTDADAAMYAMKARHHAAEGA